jgi:hypothetical protein
VNIPAVDEKTTCAGCTPLVSGIVALTRINDTSSAATLVGVAWTSVSWGPLRGGPPNPSRSQPAINARASAAAASRSASKLMMIWKIVHTDQGARTRF